MAGVPPLILFLLWAFIFFFDGVATVFYRLFDLRPPPAFLASLVLIADFFWYSQQRSGSASVFLPGQS